MPAHAPAHLSSPTNLYKSQEPYDIHVYKNASLQMIISLGAGFSEESTVEVEYLVTVLDENQNEVYQQGFKELELAIEFANDRYGSWDFSELSNKSSDDGCGTCEAH